MPISPTASTKALARSWPWAVKIKKLSLSACRIRITVVVDPGLGFTADAMQPAKQLNSKMIIADTYMFWWGMTLVFSPTSQAPGQ